MFGRFATWLGANRGLRFFAYLHVMEPHDPYTPDPHSAPPPPPGARPQIVGGRAHELATALRQSRTPALTAAELSHLRALYDAEVHELDQAIARLLATLDRLAVRDSTVVVLLADHGEAFLEHGKLVHNRLLTEELLRIPLIVNGPGVAPARVMEPVQQVDVYPTVAAILGFPLPPGLTGANLLAPITPRPAFSETEYGDGIGGKDTELVALRAPPWKLIWVPVLARYELFDLAHDPSEHTNRFDDAPEAGALAARLADWRTTAAPPPAAIGYDPALRNKLRALGYVD